MYNIYSLNDGHFEVVICLNNFCIVVAGPKPQVNGSSPVEPQPEEIPNHRYKIVCVQLLLSVFNSHQCIQGPLEMRVSDLYVSVGHLLKFVKVQMVRLKS